MSSEVTLPLWQYTYTITFTRLKNTIASYYTVALGIKGWDIDIGSDPTLTLQVHSYVSGSSLTNFNLVIFFKDNTRYRNIKMTYMAVNYQHNGLWINQQFQTINSTLTSTSPYSALKTYSLVSTITYQYRWSINSLAMSYSVSSATSLDINLGLVQISTGNLNITVSTVTGCYVNTIGYYILIFDSAITYDWKKQNIFMFGNVMITGVAGDFYAQTASTIHQPKYPYNYFICLRGFDSINHSSSFQFLITNDNKLFVHKYANMTSLLAIPILIYGNKCYSPFQYDQAQQMCKMCIPYCLQCDTFTTCTTCFDNFTLSPTNDTCTCPFDIVTNICYDFDNSLMKGCMSAVLGSNVDQIHCLFCSFTLNYYLVGNQCHCKSGFQMNSITHDCQQICGDGLVYSHQCDDGNLINGDGCNSQCDVEDSFKCNNNVSPSYCTSNAIIGFKVIQIMRNPGNQAVLKLQPNYLPIPVDLQENQFSSQSFLMILTKSLNPLTYYNLNPQLISIDNNIITISIDYEFTIEDKDASISINMSRSKYPNSEPKIISKLNGQNKPLLFSQLSQLFQKTSIAFIAVAGFILLLLFAGIIANKFIGLQGIVTLQLIFYSQLLIERNNKWPIGFKMFQSLKHANGLNSFFSLTKYQLRNQIQKKFYHLDIQKLFVENFNLNFGLLLLTFVFFLSTNHFRSLRQTDLLQTHYKNRSPEKDEPLSIKGLLWQHKKNIIQKGNIKQVLDKQIKLNFWLSINEKAYNAILQISFWCTLQLIAGISANIIIPNCAVMILTSESNFMFFQHISMYVLMFTFFIVLLVGCSLFGNLLMSDLTLGKKRERMMQLNYKKCYFVYLNVIGWILLGFNDLSIMNIVPMSMFVLIIHGFYMVILGLLKPYKMSLKVHTVGLWLCQTVYLIFLLFINLINFTENLPQILILCLGYLVLAFCIAIIVFTVIRLYYEYRYGQQLEIQIQKERELQKKIKLEKQELLLKKKMFKLQQQSKRLISEQQKQKQQNSYLYENQISHDNKNQLIQWLNNRPNWTKEIRQEFYYRKFEAKPIEWIKQNDPQKYELINKQKQVKRQKLREKQLDKKNDPNYKKIVEKLKQSFNQKNKNQSYSLI